MKNNLLLSLLFFPAAIFAQEVSFQINGQLDSVGPYDKLFLQYKQDGDVINDSVDVVDGKFSFDGVVTEPTRATLAVSESLLQSSRSPRKIIYLESGTINLIGGSLISEAKVEGGDVNTDANKLNGLLTGLNDKNKALGERYRNASEEERKREDFLSKIQTESEQINKERTEIIKSFIASHSNSLVSLDNISNVVGYSPEVEDIESVFLSLSETIRNSNAGKQYAESIEKIRAVSIGKAAPNFQQEDVDGRLVSLQSFKGKYVLIDFWASWCGPCRQENPNVVKAYHALKDKNFTVLGISLDRPGQKEAWLKAIQDDELAWTQLSDLKFWDNAIAKLYNIRSIPQNFLIDPNGVIVAKNLRGEDLLDKISVYIQ